MDRRRFLFNTAALFFAASSAACRRRSAIAGQSPENLPAFTRCVSLAELQQRLLADCTDGACSGDPLLTLAGLTRLDGFLIARAHRDILLVGAVGQSPASPPLHTADLVVALRSATHRYLDDQGRFSPPGVSIDPQPSIIKRLMQFDASGLSEDDVQAERTSLAWKEVCQSPQDVRIIGLAPEGNHYLSLIELADETMKSYVDGTLELPGLEVPSRIVLARFEADLKKGRKPALERGFSMSRYWFNAGTVRCAVDAGACLLLQCDVRLSTEAQMLARNQLADSQHRDALADDCADSFTRLLPRLAEDQPLYHELFNIYRAQSLAVSMVRRDAMKEAGLVLDPLLDRWQVPIHPVPKQVNGRWAIHGADFRQEQEGGYAIFKLRIPSCGGVSVNPEPREIDRSRDERFAAVCRAAIAARPDPSALFWDSPAVNVNRVA